MRWSLDRLTRCFVELYVKNFLCANQYILNFLHGLYISYVTQHIIISNALQPSASFFLSVGVIFHLWLDETLDRSNSRADFRSIIIYIYINTQHMVQSTG